MADHDWHDRMNAEYGSARTDEERLAVLSKYMSPDQARTMMGHLASGVPHGTREPRRRKAK